MAMIGIDLGTTNSLVAAMRNGEALVLANELDEQLTPSVVAVAEDGELLVGRAAKDRLLIDPDSGIACFKRDMGTPVRYKLGKKSWTPTECSAVVLKEMIRIARIHLGETITEAVITVPAYFHDQQRQATLEAAEIAGLKVKRLINEPTAAALAFGYREPNSEQELFVFDLGGGTFDVTLLEIFDGIIEVKASGGVSRLGGEDYTDAIASWLIKKAGSEPDEKSKLRWRQQIEIAKRRLTRQEETVVTMDGKELKVSREDFESAASELTARVRPVIKRCLRDAAVDPADLDDVLLVGGASRMPLVAKIVAEELGRLPNQTLDPDKVIALGAAVQSALIDGNVELDEVILTDVCSHTLGVETAREISPGRIEDGYFAPIIDRNTTVPTSRADVFHTLHPQQDEVNLRVFQGEGRKVSENLKIGEINISGLKYRPGQNRAGEVEVRFTYDMNGILEVEATILETGKKIVKIFEQRPGNLSKKEILEAIKRLAPLKMHPRDKLPNRARIERANRLYEDLIGPVRENLSILVSNFESALKMQDGEQIKITAAALDSFTGPYFSEESENQPPPKGA